MVVEVENAGSRRRVRDSAEFVVVLKACQHAQLLLEVQVDADEVTCLIEWASQGARIEHGLVVMIPNRKHANGHENTFTKRQSLDINPTDNPHHKGGGNHYRGHHNIEQHDYKFVHCSVSSLIAQVSSIAEGHTGRQA